MLLCVEEENGGTICIRVLSRVEEETRDTISIGVFTVLPCVEEENRGATLVNENSCVQEENRDAMSTRVCNHVFKVRIGIPRRYLC